MNEKCNKSGKPYRVVCLDGETFFQTYVSALAFAARMSAYDAQKYDVECWCVQHGWSEPGLMGACSECQDIAETHQYVLDQRRVAIVTE